MRTVYILGAGASKHVGYPLISDMGRQWLDWMAAYPNGRFRGSAEFLVERFGAAPNIEDVITELESSIDSLADSDVLEDKSKRMRVGTVRGQMSEALREWFRELHLHPAPAYAEFADHVIQPGDVVISFNYDDSLERELRRPGKWDLSQGYGFALGKAEQSSPILILKLHGSMNWLASIFGGVMSGPMQIDPSSGTLGQHPVIHRADTEYLGYSDFSGHTYPGGGALVSLILPGRNKDFRYRTSFGVEWEPFFNHLWSQAKEALKLADRIVVCGFSMLPADKRACDMILRAPSKDAEVEIICGSQGQRIEADFRNAGYRRVSFDASGRFEQWVESEAARIATVGLKRVPLPTEKGRASMEQLKDEFSDTPVTCPKCGRLATSVNKTGNKIFYNHGDARAEFKAGEMHVNWNSCEVDRPMSEKKS
jgi:hypothetical protein